MGGRASDWLRVRAPLARPGHPPSTMSANTLTRGRVSAMRRLQRRLFHVRHAPEPPNAEISQLLASYAAHPPHPLTLNSLVAFGQPLTPESVLRSVSFVLSEIPRRLARRARALETLPFIVGTNPYVSKTLNAYRQSFQFLASYPPVTTLEENTSFTAELSHLVESHRNDIPTMAKGFVFLRPAARVHASYVVIASRNAANTCLRRK